MIVNERNAKTVPVLFKKYLEYLLELLLLCICTIVNIAKCAISNRFAFWNNNVAHIFFFGIRGFFPPDLHSCWEVAKYSPADVYIRRKGGCWNARKVLFLCVFWKHLKVPPGDLSDVPRSKNSSKLDIQVFVENHIRYWTLKENGR